jgi:hypothetical protein
MKILNKQKAGQTLIETALILFLILLILLGISEFARAWFTKNSLKNAARSGARVAVVTPDISNETRPYSAPGDCETLTGNDKVFCYIWRAPGKLPSGSTASATLTIIDNNSDGINNGGDTVSVSVGIMNFQAIVPGFFRSFIPSQLSADASMRYE